MLKDDRSSVRFDAVRRILKCRESEEVGIRFMRPELLPLNFNATEYYNLCDYTLNDNVWLEPVFTKHLSSQTLSQITPSSCPLFTAHIRPYPSHTQSVEREIRLINETATTSISIDQRDGRIRTAMRVRRLMPNGFKSKKDYAIFDEDF